MVVNGIVLVENSHDIILPLSHLRSKKSTRLNSSLNPVAKELGIYPL